MEPPHPPRSSSTATPQRTALLHGNSLVPLWLSHYVFFQLFHPFLMLSREPREKQRSETNYFHIVNSADMLQYFRADHFNNEKNSIQMWYSTVFANAFILGFKPELQCGYVASLAAVGWWHCECQCGMCGGVTIMWLWCSVTCYFSW